MGGDIKVKSRPNLGTSMIAVFPSETCPEASVFDSIQTPNTPRQNVTGKSCMILDDVPENVYILRELLEKNGLHVSTHTQAKAALAEYKRTPTLDLIITDLRLPEISGQLFMLEIRKLEAEFQRPRVPIIVLTGEACPTEKVACLSQYGADDYLIKPVKMKELMNSIERCFINNKMQRRSKNVLLIDDDAVGQKIISNIVKKGGDLTHSCMTISEAKAEFELNYMNYDLVLLDSQLPDGTGRDFMEFWSKFERKVPVVSMSGNSVRDQETMYTGFEVYAFLIKPISKAQLLDVIKSIK